MREEVVSSLLVECSTATQWQFHCLEAANWHSKAFIVEILFILFKKMLQKAGLEIGKHLGLFFARFRKVPISFSNLMIGFKAPLSEIWEHFMQCIYLLFKCFPVLCNCIFS